MLKKIIENIKIHKNVLENKYGVINIAIFGSYVKGNFTNKSDIDIFVELKSSYLNFDNFMELKFYLEELFNLKIDLSIKNSIRPELQDKIYQEAIYV